ncbi:MAG: hypothetical protein KKI01_14405 [Proteobacteria bacterium]|nr:hypothetical protein [Pseudomonadota bacterium]
MGKKVPGAPAESRNLYDVSQSLAWLAKERRDIQEQPGGKVFRICFRR